MNKKVIKKHPVEHMWIPDDQYKVFMAQLPICTVDIIYFDKSKQRVLLFKRLNKPLKGKYYSSGGRMMKNETFEDCAVRQAKNELGIKINKKKLVFGGVINEIHSESIYPNTSYHCVNVYFGYELRNKKIKLDSQHSVAQWVSIGNTKLHPFIKEKIKFLSKKND